MKTLLCTFFLLLPLIAVSQENTSQKDTLRGNISEEIRELKARISELERIKNKIKISGQEVTFRSFPKIKFDFNNPEEITIPREIKEGEFYQIEVTGINLNQYLMVMENSDTVYSTPLSFPTFGTLDLSSLSGLVTNLLVKTNVSNDEKAMAALKNYGKSVSNNKSIPGDSLREGDQAIDQLFEEYALRMEQQRKQKDIRGLITSRIKSDAVKASAHLVNLKAISDEIDNLKYNYMAYRTLRQTNDTSDDFKPVIKKDLKTYDSLRISLRTLKQAIDADVKSLTALIDTDNVKVFLADPKNVDLKDNLAKSEKALTEISEKTAKALEIISSDNVEKQLRSVVNLYQGNTYTSLPIQYNKEQAEVKIKFVPKDSVSRLQPYYLSPIQFPQQRFYWSVGPSMYYAKLVNERVGTQVIQENDSTQKYQLLKESPLEREMGAAILLRGGAKLWKSSLWLPSLGVHFAAGTGLSLGEDVRPRMLLGGGFTIGQKHSLAIDFGGIGGSVKVVSKNADYKQLYNEMPEVLINDFQFKFFWSVGYAFRL